MDNLGCMLKVQEDWTAKDVRRPFRLTNSHRVGLWLNLALKF